MSGIRVTNFGLFRSQYRRSPERCRRRHSQQGQPVSREADLSAGRGFILSDADPGWGAVWRWRQQNERGCQTAGVHALLSQRAKGKSVSRSPLPIKMW